MDTKLKKKKLRKYIRISHWTFNSMCRANFLPSFSTMGEFFDYSKILKDIKAFLLFL